MWADDIPSNLSWVSVYWQMFYGQKSKSDCQVISTAKEVLVILDTITWSTANALRFNGISTASLHDISESLTESLKASKTWKKTYLTFQSASYIYIYIYIYTHTYTYIFLDTKVNNMACTQHCPVHQQPRCSPCRVLSSVSNKFNYLFHLSVMKSNWIQT